MFTYLELSDGGSYGLVEVGLDKAQQKPLETYRIFYTCNVVLYNILQY